MYLYILLYVIFITSLYDSYSSNKGVKSKKIHSDIRIQYLYVLLLLQYTQIHTPHVTHTERDIDVSVSVTTVFICECGCESEGGRGSECECECENVSASVYERV